MRFTSNWFDTGPSTCAAATRHGMCMMAVAALALGWATTAVADNVPETGQKTCYKLERADQAVVDLGLGYALDDPVYRDPYCTGNIVLPGEGTISDCPIACAGTGQDGEFQMEATLLYYNRRNRILDGNTLLEWEKKSNDGSIHDKDNTYTWEDAFEYVKTLNNMCEKQQLVNLTDLTYACAEQPDPDAFCAAKGLGECGFTGEHDWRLPNVKELQSIVNFEVLSPGPAVHNVFNTANCHDPNATVTVLTGSCTHADDLDVAQFVNDPSLLDAHREDQFTRVPRGQGISVGAYYWASTSGDAPGDAWFVSFHGGDTGAHFKDVAIEVDADSAEPTGFKTIFAGHVRAVRAGQRPGGGQ